MDTNILKNNGIDISSGIEILGDIDTYNDILKEFADNFPERLSKIEEYKNTSDMENYAIEVHAMKGDSKYLGFTKLADLALNHQLKSQDGDIDYINNNYSELITEANRVYKVINEYLNSWCQVHVKNIN